jgi:hypothetical protein
MAFHQLPFPFGTTTSPVAHSAPALGSSLETHRAPGNLAVSTPITMAHRTALALALHCSLEVHRAPNTCTTPTTSAHSARL